MDAIRKAKTDYATASRALVSAAHSKDYSSIASAYVGRKRAMAALRTVVQQAKAAKALSTKK